MARALIATQEGSSAGITLTWTAVTADGIKFRNDPGTGLLVKTGSTATTPTAITPGTVEGLAIADKAGTAISTNNAGQLLTYSAGTYNVKTGADAGLVYVDFSAQTQVTVAVIRLR